MTFMHIDSVSASTEQFIVNLNDDPFGAAVGGFNYQWGWYFTNLGFVQEYRNGALVTIQSSTDWITPRTGFTAADYEVRGHIFTESCSAPKLTGGSNAFVGNGGGDWYGLGSTRIYRFEIQTNFDNEFCNGTIRFEIRNIVNTAANTKTSQNDGSTSIIDDAEYTYNIEIGFE